MKLRPLLILSAAALLAGQEGCASSSCADTATCTGTGGDSSLKTDAEAETDLATPDAAPGGDAPSEAGLDAPVDVASDGPEDVAAEAATEAAAQEAGGQDAAVPDAAAQDAAHDGASTPCNPAAPDCSNSQCQAAFACIPEVPSGWFGPVALYDQGGGPPPPTAADCSGGYTHDAFDGFANPTSPALTCTCTCGAAQGSCSSASIGVYSDGQCMDMCATAGAPSCMTADGPTCNTGGGSVMVLQAPQATGTWSCSAGTMTTTTSWGWAHVGRGCGTTRALAAGGCGEDQVCADIAPPDFQAHLCVYQNANLADCSGAPGYSLMYKYFTNAVDGRSCALGTCGCPSATNATCSLETAQWFNTAVNSGCASGGHPIAVSGCNTNLGGSQVVTIETSISGSGSCQPTGSGASTGSVTPDTTTAITVCCAP